MFRILDQGRAVAWVARIAWVAVAVGGGSAVESAVDGRSAAVRWVVAVGSWTVWAVALAALLIVSTVGLTVARLTVPLGLAAGAAAGLAGASAIELVALLVPAIIAASTVLSAEFARYSIQASAYGDEQRFPLRTPAAAGVAAVLSWITWSIALVTGPLLIAARSYVAGIPLTLVAAAGAVVLGPRWHAMSLRWLVFVPAGLVVRDPVVLADTLMLRRAQVAAIGLARADTQAADLTGPASGYALEVTTTESVTAVFSFTPAEPNGRAIHMTAFLVSPARPGQALRAAADRDLPIV